MRVIFEWNSRFGTSIAKFGAIDVLVNNAGFGSVGVFESLSRKWRLWTPPEKPTPPC